ncbi:MAG TPA: Asp-tRNA(Asn)/Glu-tRNA(Gln) amidotransferase subunit GatC [Nitrospiria bacterium]
MEISKQDVEHVAKLARLALSEEEKNVFTRQLSDILTYIGKLNELKTDGIEPTSHVLDLHTVLREDSVRESLKPDDFLSRAPDREGAFFRVPKIIEERQ